MPAASVPQPGVDEPAPIQVQASDSKLPERPARVLVADDEHLMATSAVAHLESLGYGVVGPVSDGRAAIHTAEVELPDMCLLDIRMPEVDGLVAATTIWSTLGIPSILISAYSNDEYVRQAQQNGVWGYLLKPVTAESLRVTISLAWSKVRQHDALHERATQLQRALFQRKRIEEAKWVLVRELGIDEASAHSTMQRYARTTRRILFEVATSVVDGSIPPSELIPKPKPPRR